MEPTFRGVFLPGFDQSRSSRRYNVSWQWVHTLFTRYNDGGLDALESRSRRPASNKRATPASVAERIIELRKQLDAAGLDARPVTIAHHLRIEATTSHQPQRSAAPCTPPG